MNKSEDMETRGSGRILVVDDDRDILLSAQMILKHEFKTIRTIANPSELVYELANFPPDLVLLDMNFTRGMTDGDEGCFWLQRIKQIDATIEVVMSTAYSEVELAVKAIKLGATDFVQKPWLTEKLIATLKATLHLGASRREISQLNTTRKELTHELNKNNDALLGVSSEFSTVLDLIEKVAPTEANILITGENGTGKELVARAIHAKSLRKDGPLISVDAGAVPPTLFESEMFGHIKGAFTDANETRQGKFELAAGGTLFLDEIGNLDLNIQAKLLRAIESRSITRVGGDRIVPTDVRLVCATNLPLKDLIKADIFRQDLLYRINTVQIRIPTLRERREDIPILVQHFKVMFCNKYNKTNISIPKSTLKALMSYTWPGNIRELKHATERAIIIASNKQLCPQDFINASLEPTSELSDLNLGELEKKAILQAVRQYRGNLTQVAKALGLGRATLYRKMEKYGLNS